MHLWMITLIYNKRGIYNVSLAKATECMKLKTILSGIGILTETSVVFNDDVLMIDCDNVKVYIPSSEISIYPVKKSLIQYITLYLLN